MPVHTEKEVHSSGSVIKDVFPDKQSHHIAVMINSLLTSVNNIYPRQ